MRALILALCLSLPAAAAFAVDTDKPPEPTPTTTVCTGGTVWDSDEGACVPIEDSRLDDDALYEAGREFAHAGRYDDAIAALSAMSERRTDRVLTYMGFTLRKSGQFARGMGYYAAALSQNPGNLLARAYLGQGLAERGDIRGALVQLDQIRARGGSGSWPERALLASIRETGAPAPGHR